MARHGAGAVLGSGAVIAVAAGFLALALTTAESGRGSTDGLHLRAVFPSSDGLEAGDTVALAGIPVGQVLSVRLDRRTFLADVDLAVASDIAIPTDSRFAITGGGMSDGVLAIEPGRATSHLAQGAVVTATVSAESLEQQVGNYIFGDGGIGAN